MQKNSHMWCVLRFGAICPIIKHKNTCAGKLILVKVTGWSLIQVALISFSQVF